MGVDGEYTQGQEAHATRHEEQSMDINVLRWKQEREERSVSWDSFCQALRVFDEDLGIVNHPDTPKRKITDEPHSQNDEHGHAQYSLSTAGMTETELKNAINGKNIVVLVMCMDARAQHQTYEQVKKNHSDAVILTLSMGGGMVQQDEIIRGELRVNVYRSQALATELSYLSQIIPDGSLEAVYATGHDCQCGACKYFNNDKAVHEVLGAVKGGEEEGNEMRKRIDKGAQDLIPLQWASKTRKYLVHIDPVANQFGEMIEI